METKKISFGGEDTFANPRIEFDAKFHLKYKMVFYTLFVTSRRVIEAEEIFSLCAIVALLPPRLVLPSRSLIDWCL